MSGKYFSIGFETGYEIAKANINELSTLGRDEFCMAMAEHESDTFRQYTPFEFLAKEINDFEARWNRKGELWECYDNGVLAGIEQAVREAESE